MMRFVQVPLILGLAFILGCSKEEGDAGGRNTLDDVKQSGKVIIGVGQEAAPFGYMEDDKLVGFDVDIARAVVKKLASYAGKDLEVVFKAVTDETRIGWVQSGEVHMSLCHTNITRKRDANIDFTVPYGWDGKGVMYSAAGGKLDLSDFAGKTIGIKRASWRCLQDSDKPDSGVHTRR